MSLPGEASRGPREQAALASSQFTSSSGPRAAGSALEEGYPPPPREQPRLRSSRQGWGHTAKVLTPASEMALPRGAAAVRTQSRRRHGEAPGSPRGHNP